MSTLAEIEAAVNRLPRTEKQELIRHITATLQEPSAPAANPFAHRRLLPAYARHFGSLAGGTDSTRIVSDERDAR